VTGAIAEAEVQAWRAAIARDAELEAEIAAESAAVTLLANRIETQAGSGPHPRRDELNRRRRQLATLQAAKAIQQRLVAKRYARASAARGDARSEEYGELIGHHLAAVAEVAASVAQLDRFVADVEDGQFTFMLPRIAFRDLGSLDDPRSALRELFEAAKKHGFPLPDLERLGLEAPAELYQQEVAK
jgi:alkylhydroperoxidase/carboxymuconolactone decarboxylase family protein YurZ